MRIFIFCCYAIVLFQNPLEKRTACGNAVTDFYICNGSKQQTSGWQMVRSAIVRVVNLVSPFSSVDIIAACAVVYFVTLAQIIGSKSLPAPGRRAPVTNVSPFIGSLVNRAPPVNSVNFPLPIRRMVKI